MAKPKRYPDNWHSYCAFGKRKRYAGAVLSAANNASDQANKATAT
ncbi:hypothetical protein [Microcoleus sp.]